MTAAYDVVAVGNAIVDVISPADDAFLEAEGLPKGGMSLIDQAQADTLYGRMAAGIETSGGSAANTVAGVASFGGKAGYIGKVADDQLGAVFQHDIKAIGVAYGTKPLTGGLATARCLINVTPDGQRTMSTFLGASNALTADDLDAEMIRGATVLYLEGYLFDPDEARKAFAKAATIARGAGRKISLTLSDGFVVDRHRAALMAFIESDVDILFANENEVKALMQTDDFDAAAAGLRPHIEIAALTRSEKGSVVVTKSGAESVPAAPVDAVIDTTGAGDQYAAGFLYGFARGKPLGVCGRLGSLAAAEVISHYGPRPQTPFKDLAAKAGL
jgi:sugar/nucleoside kinase (ribokinase family)